MTLPQRIAHIVRHGMAVLHPCVYGELGAAGAVGGQLLAVGLRTTAAVSDIRFG